MGDNSGETQSSLPNRRSIAKGAAWASPVLVATSLAPSVAASPGQDCTALGGQIVSYWFDLNVPGTPIKSGLTDAPRPFALGDSRKVSSFPQILTVTAAAGNTCTIPAGTIVARLNANLFEPNIWPSTLPANNSVEVWNSDGTGSRVANSSSTGHEVTIITSSPIAPGRGVSIQLTYVAKAGFEYVALIYGDLKFQLTARAPASGVQAASSLEAAGTRSTIGLAGGSA